MTSNFLLSLAQIADYVFYLIIALLILMLMITIHEFGHYVFGKMFKFKIDEFSIGFGKAIYSKKTKSGELFSIRLIPLGGYCAFDEGNQEESEEDQNQDKSKIHKLVIEDNTSDLKQSNSSQDDGAESKQNIDNLKSNDLKLKTKDIKLIEDDSISDKNSLDGKNKNGEKENSKKNNIVGSKSCSAQNSSVVLKVKQKENAEIPFNKQAPWKRIIVLTGGVLFNFISAIIFSFILLIAFGYDIPEVKSVETTGVNAQLMVGDIITHVEGERVDYVYGATLNELLQKHNSNDINITIKRDGEILQTHLYKRIESVEGKDVGYLDLTIGAYRHNFAKAITRCVPLTFEFAWKILEFLGLLITGQVALSSVTGPITTITTIASFTQQSIANLFVFLPFISVNLAVFNLLPIPSLDGSKIVFTLIEWIRGKPINPKIENTIHAVGLLALLGLVVFIDIFHIFFT